jgi:hypothetical protein
MKEERREGERKKSTMVQGLKAAKVMRQPERMTGLGFL